MRLLISLSPACKDPIPVALELASTTLSTGSSETDIADISKSRMLSSVAWREYPSSVTQYICGLRLQGWLAVMMEGAAWSERDDFSVLGSFDLAARHVLHPSACNPAMDLVALLAPQAGPTPRAPVFPGWHPKGKQKAAEPSGGSRTKVSLWRVSKSMVWEVVVPGEVVGLAWTEDGQHLSVLALNTAAGPAEPVSRSNAVLTCHHLSVHTGSTVRKTPCSNLLEPSSPQPESTSSRWWHMQWIHSDQSWPEHLPGSALNIIHSLPGPSKVEPLKPPNYDVMMRINPAAAPPLDSGPHSSLSTFPSLLTGSPAHPPDLLVISPPQGGTVSHLLTGCFPLSSNNATSSSLLRFAQISSAMSDYLNIILRGLESAEHAFREAEKQTMIWREELETAATQQGMSKEAVHADLLRMLLAGRCDVAVSEWFGGKLTGRTVAKWEVTLDASFRLIRKVITDSVMPAVERIILLFEDLYGQSRVDAEGAIHLSADAISSLLDHATAFTVLLEHIRQEADHELSASSEFIRWLKYEIHRAAHQDVTPESVALMSYDVKLTWAFLKNGFVASPLTKHFPPRHATPPYDVADLPDRQRPSLPSDTLDASLAKTLSILHQSSPEVVLRKESAVTATSEAQDTSIESSLALTSQGQSSPYQEAEELPSRAESPDSGVTIPMRTEGHGEEVYEKDDWAWYWADVLRDQCERLVLGAASLDEATTSPRVQQDDVVSAVRAQRLLHSRNVVVDRFAVAPTALHLTVDSQSLGPISIDGAGDEYAIIDLQFFDDAELAVLLMESPGSTQGKFLLITVATEQLLAADISHPLPVARAAQLYHGEKKDEVGWAGMALNGRAGRRFGFFMMPDGRTITALDMEAAEEEQEGGESDEGLEGEEADMEGVEG